MCCYLLEVPVFEKDLICKDGVFILMLAYKVCFLRFGKAFGLCLSKQTLPAKTFERETRTTFINLAESFIKEQEKRLGFDILRVTVLEK